LIVCRKKILLKAKLSSSKKASKIKFYTNSQASFAESNQMPLLCSIRPISFQ
jgi:hypothetical protein